MPIAALSADTRHWHHCLQDGERSKCLRSSPTRNASDTTHRTHTSAASPLQLSDEPSNSRSGGAVSINLPRSAGAEGARERRDSHAASLNEGLGGVHVQDMHSPLLGFEPWGVSHGEWD